MSTAGVPEALPALSANCDADDPLRILLVADMRSPHSINWVNGLLTLGIQTIIVSSRRLNGGQRMALPKVVLDSIVHEPRDPLSRTRVWLTDAPGILRAARKIARGSIENQDGGLRKRGHFRPEGVGRFELPLELTIAVLLRRTIRKTVKRSRPNLVHALRVPFEGIAAGKATAGTRFAISIWGSDLVKQAASSPRLAKATRRALRSVDAVHADCHRDVMLAHDWGVSDEAHSIVAPGNMGFDSRLFNVPHADRTERNLVIFPRGPATAINYLGFMETAARLVPEYSRIQFMGVRLKGDPQCEAIRRASSHPERIILTGLLPQAELARLYQKAIAIVSPSASDGTPNSVLEGMACGAIPIVGDISSIRELLMPAFAESLFPPYDTCKMHASIERVLRLDPKPRATMSERAQKIAAEWSREATLYRVQRWYQSILGDSPISHSAGRVSSGERHH
jgi:glycosyltransferase involved in cell wall biosynthesis